MNDHGILKLNKAQRDRLRSVAGRLYRDGDDHTMSGGFGTYYEGDDVEAALDDLEACLALLREVADAFNGPPACGVIAGIPFHEVRCLLASEVK